MTQPSTPRLSEVAQHLVIPSGVVSTGWPLIEDRLTEMGVTFDWWQEAAVKLVLGKRANGKYAATVGGVVWSIPRQSGKSFVVGSLLVAMCLEYPGLKVVWTSHHLRTTTNTFRAMQGLVRRKTIAPFLERTARSDGVRTGSGDQEIRFANGSSIMLGARAEGFGRGIDAVDIMVFDEAQILGQKALEDMVPATHATRHPHGALLFFIGTPPRPIDDGEAFTNKRRRAIEGETEDCLYLELAADPDADPDDHEQWKKANLSFPSRVPLESMLRSRENLGSDEAWLREALGVWNAEAGSGVRVIQADVWAATEDPKSFPATNYALGVEVSPDLSWSSISLAGLRADGKWHIELYDDAPGTDWVVPTVLGHMRAADVGAVVVDAGSPSHALLADFKAAGIRVTCPKVTELGIACADLLLGLESRDIFHTDQPQMAVAAGAAGKRSLGTTGMWVWSRKTTSAVITPIQSATLALHGAKALGGTTEHQKKVKRPERRRGKVVLL